MIIVLEGPDGTGKTTLAHEFEKRRFRYVHNGPPPADRDMFETYTDELLDCEEGEDVVFDRLHVGELVYGPVMRGKSRLTVQQFRLLNRLLFGMGGVLVWCTASPDQVITSWRARKSKEYIDSEDKMFEIIRGYSGLSLTEANTLCPSVKIYDVQAYSNRAHNFVAQLISMSPQFENRFKDGVIGSPNNKYLFVGEQPGNGAYDMAFYADDGKSSGYLSSCLYAAGYHEREIAFVNAVQRGGKLTDLRSIYARRTTQVVVTLGEIARRRCFEEGIPHLSIPHPQYVKRFGRHKGEMQFIQQLRSFRREG